MMIKSKRSVIGLGIALAMSVSLVAGAQTAKTPQERREDRKERREDRQEKREDKKELREDKKELHEDKKDGASKEELAQDRKEIREDKRELREDRRELRHDRRTSIDDLRKTRQERRREHVKEVRERWGAIVNNAPVRAELKVHARRVARLNHARKVADEAGKTELVAKIDKLLDREAARHQAAMDKFKSEGGKP